MSSPAARGTAAGYGALMDEAISRAQVAGMVESLRAVLGALDSGQMQASVVLRPGSRARWSHSTRSPARRRRA